ncbi:MAG: hypothetical protein LBP58_03125 [Azoarcus sp.]|jgi:hypothetical protein|nr:hypothetical protein [Azoarcus sp.]
MNDASTNDTKPPIILPATRQLTRQEIREIVERDAAELLTVADAGGNVHQKSLDQTDAVQALAKTMPDEQAFMAMYIEELNAHTAQVENKTHQINMDAATNAYNVQAVIVLIALFAILMIWVSVLS